MSEYARYPMLMTHPAYKPAVINTIKGIDENSGRPFTDYQGTPAQRQPVTVETKEDEEYHASLGYVPAGTPSAAAYERAVQGAVPEDYKPEEYPKWANGVIISCKEEDPDYHPENDDSPGPLVIDLLSPPATDALAAAQAELAAAKAELEALKAAASAPRNRGGRPRKVA